MLGFSIIEKTYHKTKSIFFYYQNRLLYFNFNQFLKIHQHNSPNYQ